MAKENEIVTVASDSSVVVYTTEDGKTQLNVQIKDDTLWLSQAQIADLFGVQQPAISKHIKNIYACGELDEQGTYSILEYMGQDGLRTYQTVVYNLDVILSVGYRVNSKNATIFRKWATQILREYILKGYAVNQRFLNLEQRIDLRLSEHDRQIAELSEQVSSFVHASLPPREGIFFDGQIFDAYKFVVGLIEGAKRKVVLIDNYVDESVLTMLDKRKNEVTATIYTAKIDKQMKLDIEKHNAQYTPIDIQPFNKAHDRFLLIDETVFHIGASLKDLGKKWFAFTKMNDIASQDLLEKLK
ncbi:MAG: virulence RhuM family protein [Paludibacteraceae bacterium]|nr:virulence RhuM family protein [Paludibacteraceae bacterium]